MTLFNRAGATFAGFVLVLCAWSLGAQPLPVAKPEQVGMSAQRLAKIGEALKKEAADGSFRGAVVMVARKGKLVYQDAVGMQTAAAKMTPDSIFRIYSMTKPLVSVAAMMLVEDGVIQLTDPVSKYLPGFDKLQVSVPGKDAVGNTTYALVPQERQMTVQDLLRHTSGLAYGEITQNAPVKEGLEKAGVYRKEMDFDARNLAPDEQIAKMATVPLAFQPGTTWNYSLSTDMLGRVLEGQRVLSRTTVRLMAPDPLGGAIGLAMDPGLLLLGTKGYTFGLGFSVRQGDGIAGVPGAAGEFMWAGYGGTYFWVDPKEQVVAVLMTQAASPQRAYFRKLVKQLVYQAITD